MPVSFQIWWFSQIRRSAQLQKLKKQLIEKTGGETVTDELWAQAAGETEESLRRFLDAGASAKQALGETMGMAGWLDGRKFSREVGLLSAVVESYKELERSLQVIFRTKEVQIFPIPLNSVVSFLCKIWTFDFPRMCL